MSQHQRQLSLDSATPNQNSRRSSANSSRHSAAQLSAALEQLAGNGGAGEYCNDPDCRQNLNNNGATSHNGNHIQNANNNNDGEQIFEGVTELELRSDNEEQLSINEFLLETEMAASPSRRLEDRYAGGAGADEDQGDQCQDDQCAQCSEERASGEDRDAASTSSQAAASSGVGNNFYDPLLNRGSYANYSEGTIYSSASFVFDIFILLIPRWLCEFGTWFGQRPNVPGGLLQRFRIRIDCIQERAEWKAAEPAGSAAQLSHQPAHAGDDEQQDEQGDLQGPGQAVGHYLQDVRELSVHGVSESLLRLRLR